MASTHKMTTHDLGAMIKNIGQYASEAQKQAVFNAAMHMKQELERSARKDLGGKDYFSRMMQKKTRSGTLKESTVGSNRVGVRFNVKGDYTPTALLMAYGPWGLLEYGAFKHEITAKLPKVTNRKMTKVARNRALRQRDLDIAYGARGTFAGSTPLRTPFGPRYRVINHPGAKPKHTFTNAVERATPRATQIATSLIQSRTIQRLRTQYGEFSYVTGESGVFRPVVG